MTREPIRSIQNGLNALGYSPGPIDGYYGKNTREATERWLAAGGRAAPAPSPAPVPAAPRPVTTATIYQGNARYPVTEIIVHCAATRPDWMAGRPIADKVAEIRRWHMSAPLNWKDIGYHWIIDRDGKVLAGRAENVIGAHAGAVKNRGTLGVCLLGGHGSAETDRFAQHYTGQQDITLRQMIDAISLRTAIRKISGHNVYAAKACPGFDVTTWLKGA
ncbi:MAG: N-acetylmuramoyl-L-alanine amidase [Paracoccus sp.]|nr:N-acetylmuramoyl-L-alanine amidase [Paracoccus sp. (in: a-proteobacteria)]